MIISHAHGFVFVHIPKCAGTAVRAALRPFDETGGAFDERVDDHPAFGRLDYTHLPLHLLRRVEPEAFAALERHAGFAVCRDPFARFPSAVAQRIKMVRGAHIAALDARALRAEIDAATTYLSGVSQVTDPDWIHFARQVDFVTLDGARVVETVIPVERIDALRQALSARIGADLPSFGAANRRMAFTNPALRAPLTFGSTLAKRLLPKTLSDAVRARARRRWLRPAGDAAPDVFAAPDVRTFIEEYYRDDIALHRAALEALDAA
jgi:hypothetical protein